MSYQFYKVLHVVSLFLLFTSLAAAAFAPQDKRKPWVALHGIATLIALVAGFGLLARLGLMKGMPGWVHIKLAIWLALGVMPFILRKANHLALPLLLVSVLLGAIGSYVAVNKPMSATSTPEVEAPAVETEAAAPTIEADPASTPAGE
jgi:hypothetical protein